MAGILVIVAIMAVAILGKLLHSIDGVFGSRRMQKLKTVTAIHRQPLMLVAGGWRDIKLGLL